MPYVFNPFSGSLDNAPSTTKGDSAYTTLQSASTNWDNTYSTVQVNSSTNWDNTLANQYTHANFLPLTGGIISGTMRFNDNVTIFGDLSCTGTQTFANTIFTTTSAVSVVHFGSGPAMWVGNNGDGDIASFYDTDQGIEVLHVGGINGDFPNVGIKTSTPNKDFTVNGEISASNTIWAKDNNSDQWTSVYSTVQSNSSTNWNYQGTDIKSLTGNWQDTYTIVQFNSANWNSTYSTLCSISGNLATYDYLHSEFLPLSGGTITGTLSVYGGFESGTGNTVLYAGNSSVGINTETPNEELTIVGDISATGIVYASGGNSDQWNSVYSTVQSNSSTNWNYTGTDLKNLSSNWESTYNTVSSISGSWLTSFYLSSNSITISALTVTSTISAKDQIYFDNHKAIKTPTTDFAGVSAVTKIVAVSALPVIQEIGTLYILI